MRYLVEVVVETDTLTNAELVELVEAEINVCGECSVESISVKKMKESGKK